MKYVVVLLLIASVLIIACEEDVLITDEHSCMKDSDCVPDQCCHADACVNTAYMPNCTDARCTLECRPGTLDCGQANCACEDNKCIVRIE